MVAEDAKVILVTGASRGLGRAIAVELGSQGQKIVVNYAGSEDAAKETVEMVKAAGGDAVAVRANCEYLQYTSGCISVCVCACVWLVVWLVRVDCH
jgi:NAD(P)-dependent dehydrogenase (short-subunit alcohol dehydrogenase family)